MRFGAGWLDTQSDTRTGRTRVEARNTAKGGPDASTVKAMQAL